MLKQVQHDRKIHDVTLNSFQGLSSFKITQKNKQVAFTLAEVLITLVVIGVVAAISVPILMNRYQKITVANQVKKVYSTFNQAIKLAEVDNGPFLTWEYNSFTKLFDDYLSKRINKIKVKKNAHVHGYLRYEDSVRFIFTDGSQIICGSATGNILSGNNANYACMISPSGKYEWEETNIKYTKPTRQIFWFVIDKDTGYLKPPYMKQTREENIQKCVDPGIYEYGNGYTSCATLLLKDGWEFKDDYPWNVKFQSNTDK